MTDLFAFPISVRTPPYVYFKNRIATPPFGDHKLGDGSEFAVLGQYCVRMKRYNRELAEAMQLVWSMAGEPVKGLWGEALALENLMYPESQAAFCKNRDILVKYDQIRHADSGIHVFRRYLEDGTQNYLAVMSSPRAVGHGHLDQGSFVLYYHNIPVIMDSGIEGYFNAGTSWHISSYSHSVMQFETGRKAVRENKEEFVNLSAGDYSIQRGWSDGPKDSKVIGCEMKNGLDRLTIEIQNPEGNGVQTRTLLFHEEDGSLEVTDEVREFGGNILFSIPLLMQTAQIQGDQVFARGYYQVDMEIRILSKTNRVWMETGRATPMAPTENGCTQLIYLRARAEASEGFRVLILPHIREHRKGEDEYGV